MSTAAPSIATESEARAEHAHCALPGSASNGGSLASSGVERPGVRRRRRARFAFGLAAILLAAAAIRSIALDADAPCGVSRDFSLTTDPGWYAAAALDATVGRESEPVPAYDRAVYTLYLRLVFSVLGPSYAAMNAASIPFALLAILFTALAARRLHGDACGLLAGLFLAASHAFFVFNRSAVPYSALAAIVAFSIWSLCDARRPHRGAAIAAIALVLGAVLVKEALVLALPLVLWRAGILEFARRRPVRVAIGAFAAIVVLAVLALTTGVAHSLTQKISDYVLVEGDGPARRVLHLESRAGIFHAMPITLALALLLPLTGRVSRREAPLCAFLVAVLLVFALAAYSPLRYLLILFPAVSVLAAGMLVAPLAHADRPRPLWRSLLAYGLAVYFAYQLASAPWPRPEDASAGLVAPHGEGATLLRSVLFGTLLAALVLYARRDRIGIAANPRWRSVTAILVAVAALSIDATRTASALSQPRHSVHAAMRALDDIVSKDAVLSGTFAHTLTTETRHARRLVPATRFGDGALRRNYDRRGVTHLLVEEGPQLANVLQRFASDGAPLVPVHRFLVRGTRLALLRFAHVDARYALSAYERAVSEAREGDPDAALAIIAGDLAASPNEGSPRTRSAPLRSLEAECLLATGARQAAFNAARAAIAIDPYDPRALAIAIRILLETDPLGDRALAEAAGLLAWLSELDPASSDLAETLARVEEDLRFREGRAGSAS